ncbi:hypothetical protein D3C80_655530 [compost metagenome]
MCNSSEYTRHILLIKANTSFNSVEEIELGSKRPIGRVRISLKDYYMEQIGPSEQTYVKKVNW